jgi:hypothetical protein
MAWKVEGISSLQASVRKTDRQELIKTLRSCTEVMSNFMEPEWIYSDEWIFMRRILRDLSGCRQRIEQSAIPR